MAAYNISLDAFGVLRISFGDPSQNDQIVKDADARLKEMIRLGEVSGGKLMKINGPASLPVGMVLAHGLSHLYQAIACYDPKLSKYVVAIAHGSEYRVGDLID